MYITSYKYDFERMMHFNISHKNVCYLNNKHRVVISFSSICKIQHVHSHKKKQNVGDNEVKLDL